jgi:nucleoside-diphosphate-sugar epimerase
VAEDAGRQTNLAGVPVLVTGATGFLGGALARRLAQQEGARVSAVGRSAQAGEALLRETAGTGLRFVRADLAEPGAAAAACAGQAVVFHCAAQTGAWGGYADFYRNNVAAAESVIAGCREAGARLVHVSTPSVCFADRPRLNVAEGDPLPARQLSHYAQTKMLAERLVSQASAEGLPAIIVRPRAVFGPRDSTLLPRLLRQLARGRLPVLGSGRNFGDLSYVDNVVDALLLCAGAPQAALGRTFHITNGEPVRLWEAIEQLCDALGYARPRGRLPLPAALILAALLEWTHAALRRPGEPLLTRYAVRLLALDATLDIRAARRDLGYAPRVSLAEGLRRTAEWWRAGHEA